MKRKIVAIGMLCMLLLVGLATSPALGMNVEKLENSPDITSMSEGSGNICIQVYIRYNPLRNGPLEGLLYNIPVDDATVTAESLEDGTIYDLEFHTDILWSGYYLLNAPVGNYLFKAERGFRSGSVEHSITDGGMTCEYINLAFTKNVKTCNIFPANLMISMFYEILTSVMQFW